VGAYVEALSLEFWRAWKIVIVWYRREYLPCQIYDS